MVICELLRLFVVGCFKMLFRFFCCFWSHKTRTVLLHKVSALVFVTFKIVFQIVPDSLWILSFCFVYRDTDLYILDCFVLFLKFPSFLWKVFSAFSGSFSGKDYKRFLVSTLDLSCSDLRFV